MTDAVLDVELLSKPTDWWVLRKTRLRALRDAPDAFASTYRIESAWPPGRWRDQFAAGTWVVGPVEAGERTGLAGCCGHRPKPRTWSGAGSRRATAGGACS